MIDRDQVLHVARLARLELSEHEIERMGTELSGVLDYIEKIEELDLDDVDADVARRRRRQRAAPRRAAPVPAAEQALAQAPDPCQGGFRVPSPGA